MSRSVPIFLLSVFLNACMSQGVLHPNLSPVGQVVANVNTVDDAASLVQNQTMTIVRILCNENQTASCRAAQLAEPVMRTVKTIGDLSNAVGLAFQVYLATTTAVTQASAKATLLEKVAQLVTAGEQLKLQSFQQIQDAVQAVNTDIATLKASAMKGL